MRVPKKASEVKRDEMTTCSKPCAYCTQTITFDGVWSDEEIPQSFACPYCHKMNEKPRGEPR